MHMFLPGYKALANEMALRQVLTFYLVIVTLLYQAKFPPRTSQTSTGE